MWPDVGVESSPIFSKICPKSSQFGFYIRVRFSNWPKKLPIIWASLAEILLTRAFKNRPVWSHWPYWAGRHLGIDLFDTNNQLLVTLFTPPLLTCLLSGLGKDQEMDIFVSPSKVRKRYMCQVPTRMNHWEEFVPFR